MKFYPLRNWRSGQPTVLIDGNTYYTLESATEWEITEAEEFTVSMAAHKGEEWIRDRETMKRKTVMEEGQKRSGEDREWISKMLAKDSTRIVSSQQVIIVAPTPSGHQDAGTIKLDPERRRKEEEEKKEEEKEKEKENDKEGKEIGTGKGKGKGRGKGKGKVFRTSPPVTRARKRSRKEESPGTRTTSQDSCTPRNPLRSPTPPAPTFSAGI